MDTINEVVEFSQSLNKIDERYGKITILDNGLASGRLIEIFGDESSEKIKLTLIAVAEAQKAGGICAFIDATNTFDSNLAEKLGVDVENLIISKSNNDEAWDITDNLIRSGVIDIIAINSTFELSVKETTYRLEFNEKQQNFHLDDGDHEENTVGWVTIASQCTDKQHEIFMRIVGVFEDQMINKEICDSCFAAAYAISETI